MSLSVQDMNIKTDLSCAVRAFAVTSTEQEFSTGFVMYCMQVAAGFMCRYKEYIGSECPGLARDKLQKLSQLRDQSDAAIKLWRNGTPMHPDVDSLLQTLNKQEVNKTLTENLNKAQDEVKRLEAELKKEKDDHTQALKNLDVSLDKVSQGMFMIKNQQDTMAQTHAAMEKSIGNIADSISRSVGNLKTFLDTHSGLLSGLGNPEITKFMQEIDAMFLKISSDSFGNIQNLIMQQQELIRQKDLELNEKTAEITTLTQKIEELENSIGSPRISPETNALFEKTSQWAENWLNSTIRPLEVLNHPINSEQLQTDFGTELGARIAKSLACMQRTLFFACECFQCQDQDINYDQKAKEYNPKSQDTGSDDELRMIYTLLRNHTGAKNFDEYEKYLKHTKNLFEKMKIDTSKSLMFAFNLKDQRSNVVDDGKFLYLDLISADFNSQEQNIRSLLGSSEDLMCMREISLFLFSAHLYRIISSFKPILKDKNIMQNLFQTGTSVDSSECLFDLIEESIFNLFFTLFSFDRNDIQTALEDSENQKFIYSFLNAAKLDTCKTSLDFISSGCYDFTSVKSMLPEELQHIYSIKKNGDREKIIDDSIFEKIKDQVVSYISDSSQTLDLISVPFQDNQ